jgi:hypothetical protein
VLVDGHQVGKLRNEETGHYEVEPGRHEVALTFSRSGSKTLSITLRDGEIVRLGCRLMELRSRILDAPARYESDRWITLEPLEQPAGADIEVSAGPTVIGWKDRHRVFAVGLWAVGLLGSSHSAFLFHLGNDRAGILQALIAAILLGFGYLEWLPRSRRLEAVKAASLGLSFTVVAFLLLLSHLPLGFAVAIIVCLMLGICSLVLGTIRLFDLRTHG